MRLITCIALAFASVVSLQAQNPKFGIAFNVVFPLGEFRETTFGPTDDVHVTQIEGYDIGVGGQFTMSFPLHRNLAFRTGLGFTSTRGTNTAPGYETINLNHNNVLLSGEMQIFSGDAYRHQGSYFLAGVSINFERFERSFGDDDYYYTEKDVTRKNRLAGVIGFGHSFYNGESFSFTTELSYHTTLSNKDPYRNEPPATDFIKLSLGFVF